MNSTTFISATTLLTKNQPIDDWGNRNSYCVYMCLHLAYMSAVLMFLKKGPSVYQVI
jgi:hypothetical protein